MSSPLGEVKFVNVRRDVLLASIGFVITGLGVVLIPFMGAKVLWLPNTVEKGPVPVPVRVSVVAIPVIVGFALIYKGFSNVARKSGWSLLLEGLASWGFLLFIASVFYGHSGWTAMLWWVGLVRPAEDQVANVLISMILAVTATVILFLSASSLTPSVQLAYNLFRTDDLAESALTVYKVSATLSLTVYPIIGVAAALIMIGFSLASARGEVPVRAGLEA